MKKFLRVVASLMVVLMVLSSVPFSSLADVDLFSTTASAYTEGQYTYVLENGEATITDYNDIYYEDLIIPSEFDGYKVTKIDYHAFYDCRRLTSVKIPNTVTYIGDGAFFNCERLERVEMTDSVTYLGQEAFHWCTVLEDVVLSQNIPEIKWYTFCGCKNLENIVIPNSVGRLGKGVFDDTSIKNIIIPKNVNYLGEDLFAGCPIEKITILNRNCEIAGNYFVTSDNATFYGFNNSTTSTFALEEGYKFVPFCTDSHEYTATSTVKATTIADGSTERSCPKCTYVDYKVIPKVTSFSLSTTTYAYDGKVKTPKVVVKDRSGKTLKNGKDYTVSLPSGRKNIGSYKVKVTLKGNYSGSKTLTFKIVPAAVKSLKATPSTTSVKLSWSKVSGAQGYTVFKQSGKKWVKVADTKSTTYTVKKLKAGTNYKFAVKAYAKSGSTTYYSSSYTQLSVATKPGTPTLKATAGAKKASLSWNKQTGASGYVVYMSTSKNGTYKKIATVKGGTKVGYTKTGLTKGKTYYFKVAAYKTVSGKNIYGAYSAVKSVKVK